MDNTIIEKNTSTPMFIAALFAIVKTLKQYKYPLTDEWIKQMWYIYTVEYYSTIKTYKIMPFAATGMEVETLILSEVSQKEKDRQTPYDITYMWNLKCGTNDLSTKQKRSWTCRTDSCLPGERRREWDGLGVWGY